MCVHTHRLIHAHLWRMNWQLTPVFLPWKSHEQRSLVGYSPLGNKSHTWLQFSSVAQSCPTLCNPMNHSMPGLPGHHQLPEFTQTHVHQVSDAIQPSHPLSSPSPFALNFSQEQSLFQMSLFFHIKWSKDWNFLHKTYSVQFSSVQWLSRVQLFATP